MVGMGSPRAAWPPWGDRGGVSREAVRQWHNAALLLLRLPTFSGRLQVSGQDSRAAYTRSQAMSRAGQRQRRRASGRI